MFGPRSVSLVCQRGDPGTEQPSFCAMYCVLLADSIQLLKRELLTLK